MKDLDQTVFVLNDEEWDEFMRIMTEPRELTPFMKDAIKAHRKLVSDRAKYLSGLPQ